MTLAAGLFNIKKKEKKVIYMSKNVFLVNTFPGQKGKPKELPGQPTAMVEVDARGKMNFPVAAGQAGKSPIPSLFDKFSHLTLIMNV